MTTAAGQRLFSPQRPSIRGAFDPEHDRQLRLARLNQQRLRPRLSHDICEGADGLAAQLSVETEDRIAEERFVAAERITVAPLLADVPTDARAFVDWFAALRQVGPGQGDSLFPWLAEQASLEQLRWFVGQEVAGEAGFEDLLAMTQLKMPMRPKLEIARNFWDEMGRGGEPGMHGPMLERLARKLGVELPDQEIVWEALAIGNLMVALAWNRHYAYQAIGALGVIELTAPDRARQVNLGLRRLGVPAGTRKYFALHATLDVAHARSWVAEVLFPLVESDSRLARPLAEGALLRLRAGERCFARYRQFLGRPHDIPS